jgi:hypothetical protein
MGVFRRLRAISLVVLVAGIVPELCVAQPPPLPIVNN